MFGNGLKTAMLMAGIVALFGEERVARLLQMARGA